MKQKQNETKQDKTKQNKQANKQKQTNRYLISAVPSVLGIVL